MDKKMLIKIVIYGSEKGLSLDTEAHKLLKPDFVNKISQLLLDAVAYQIESYGKEAKASGTKRKGTRKSASKI